VQKAADVLSYKAMTTGTLLQIPYHFEGLDRTALIADEHFVVERIDATAEPASLRTNGRPLILMSLNEPLEVASDKSTVTLSRYQTALIPASAEWCTVSAAGSDTSPFMFVTPPHDREDLAVRLVAAGIPQDSIDRFLEQF
jgi:mannose-6-phosphate isomerase class I